MKPCSYHGSKHANVLNATAPKPVRVHTGGGSDPGKGSYRALGPRTNRRPQQPGVEPLLHNHALGFSEPSDPWGDRSARASLLQKAVSEDTEPEPALFRISMCGATGGINGTFLTSEN